MNPLLLQQRQVMQKQMLEQQARLPMKAAVDSSVTRILLWLIAVAAAVQLLAAR
jgi:hypothetical protein